MSEELFTIIQRAVNGDEFALQNILQLYAANQIDADQSMQLHIFLKTQKTHYAVYILGLFYKYGYGIRQDYDLSFLTMREAAAKGNAKATYEVGHHFLLGYGVEQNYENAMQWLSMAAGSPYYIPEAMFDIGEMYAQGLGVTRDDEDAHDWYQKAAERGHAGAKAKLK